MKTLLVALALLCATIAYARPDLETTATVINWRDDPKAYGKVLVVYDRASGPVALVELKDGKIAPWIWIIDTVSRDDIVEIVIEKRGVVVEYKWIRTMR